MHSMKRRDLFIAPLLFGTLRSAFAGDQPWSAKLLKGGFDGIVWWSGLDITLAPHWKTYWRVPGDGGIAPSLEISGDNVKSSRVDYPLPERIVAESGTTIGYMDRVVFPIAVAPRDIAKPLKVSLKAFFGVCEEVCIPAPYAADVTFNPANTDSPDQALIRQWQDKVPKPLSAGPLTKVSAKMIDAEMVLVLELTAQPAEVFVEGNPAHYFGAPRILENVAIVPVKGAKSLDELRATPVRVTMKTGSIALEQVKSVV
jgi:DsbC/DsbD-like thiol-disulfide interchange protein